MTSFSRTSAVTAMFLTLAAVGFTQTAPPSTGSCTGQTATFKSIRLSRAVLANGVPLPAGVYDVRITTDRPAPAVGQSAAGECWVEFLKDGAVAGREVASVIGPDAIATVAKGSVPKPNTARVDELKQSEHLRVWINSDGTHFLINLPIAPELEPRPVLQPAAADAAAVR